jgi:hypothetical protein
MSLNLIHAGTDRTGAMAIQPMLARRTPVSARHERGEWA